MINSDPTLTRALQDEMKLLKEKGRRLDGLYNRSREQIKNLQNKLDTCENQNGAIFGMQPNNQVCERKIEGFGQALFQSFENISFNAKTSTLAVEHLEHAT